LCDYAADAHFAGALVDFQLAELQRDAFAHFRRAAAAKNRFHARHN